MLLNGGTLFDKVGKKALSRIPKDEIAKMSTVETGTKNLSEELTF